LTSFGEHVSDNEIGERIRMWDGDGDGKINFAEFLVAMAQILTDTENEERMRDAFRIFDKVK
jgi:calmodulin